MFQWGHDFSAMDIWYEIVMFAKSERFQWGHDFSAMDI